MKKSLILVTIFILLLGNFGTLHAANNANEINRPSTTIYNPNPAKVDTVTGGLLSINQRG